MQTHMMYGLGTVQAFEAEALAKVAAALALALAVAMTARL